MSCEDWSELARQRGTPAGEELDLWKAAATTGVDDQDDEAEVAAVVAEVAAVAPEGRKMAWREAVDKFKTERISG